MPSTGNGRRAVLRVAADPADDEHLHPERLLEGRRRAARDTASGVYVKAMGGGQVNPATGDFVFGVAEGYLIEGGVLTTPVRGANLIGRAIEVMSAVDAVARRLRHVGGRLRQGRPGRAGGSAARRRCGSPA